MTRLRQSMLPVYFMSDQRIEPDMVTATLEAIHSMLRLAGASTNPVRNYGHWRMSDYRHQGQLTAYHSLDWYRQQGVSPARQQIDITAVMDALCTEPWQQQQRHYDVVLLADDLGAQNTAFVLGAARHQICLVLSPHRLRGLDDWLKYECMVTIAMHEFGHVLGLIPEDRSDNVTHSLGLHCSNRCIMRQGLRVPSDWVQFTRDRLDGQTLCPHCLQDLQEIFS